jgi:ribosomal protein S27E
MVCVRGAQMSMVETLCPNCMTTSPVTSRAQAEAGDLEMVRCPDCGYETDFYEAAKQFDLRTPRCFVDGHPAAYYAPAKRRFFCAGCAPRVGLDDSDLIQEGGR